MNRIVSQRRPEVPGSRLPWSERKFEFRARGTNVRREILAGLTTFATMSYVLAVNPAILSVVGIDFRVLVSVTAIGAALTTAAMGLVTNYPLALAPGMGGNAFFAYQVCLGMGIPWQGALGLVFYNGVVFLLLSWTGGRELILNSVPPSLKIAVSAGIGLFIAFIGLKSGGVLVADKRSFIALAPVATPSVALVFLGLALNALLMWRRVPGSLVLGILICSGLGLCLPAASGHGTITQWPQQFVAVPASIAPTFLQLDLGYLWTHFGAAFPIVLVIFFGDLMSGLATVMGVCDRGGLVDEHGRIPRLRDALVVDALAASAGACLGTSTIAIYVESGAGVAVGGRTGLTSLVVAACFLLSLFFNPLIAAIPAVATAPALLLVGVLMMQSIVRLNLDDLTVAVPAIVTILLMAIASISDGMAIGILLHLLLMIGSGRARQVPVATYVIGLLFLAHFVF